MKTRYSWKLFAAVQVVVVGGFGAAFLLATPEARSMVRHELPLSKGELFTPVPVTRNLPIQISKPYNRPDLISDDDLGAVLKQIQPIFDRNEMKPNFVEHALRTWGVDATFQNPNAVSGKDMLAFLTDTARFVDSWGKKIQPLLQERPHGIGIHWGTDTGASYHHDHLLACVTEANAPLDTPVYGPSRRNATLYDVLQESLRDFRLDERETEWTAMAFGLWICPEHEWVGSEGRHYSFDLLADRLMRGERTLGVCAGTHRVYSLMLLIRLDDEFHILKPETRTVVYSYLEGVRDAIMASQFEDGHWPTNWPEGKLALENPIDDPEYRRVIATGHHLEWMSIAPKELLVPDEQLKKAIDWVIATTVKQPKSEIKKSFTFYSHVGAALCNWRQVRPADYWRQWESTHPYDPSEETEPAQATESASPEAAAH
ncbi:hypothetical protein SH661x_004466 [Planctomicrobium sp. SH661]|uniref:hypothetical protein n=1 Tax=Planctomicrobium sp. SH661 TaxID=3448124 RepID=UPI003F5AFF8E